MTTKDDTRPRDDQVFLGLQRLGPVDWRLPVDLSICSGTGRMFGGAASAALASAFEVTTARQLKVLHVQFLRSAAAGDELTGSIASVEVGRTVHARLAFAAGGAVPVVRASALLGADDGEPHVDRPMPDVPDPDACEPRTYQFPLPGSLNERLDIRVAAHPPGRLPRARLWVRAPWQHDASASSLALVADHVPFALAHAPDSPVADPIVTVDSSIRVIRPTDTEWLLVDVRVDSIGERFAVGSVDVWTEDRRLVAVGAQTTSRVRSWAAS